jgi:hypothetical protein
MKNGVAKKEKYVDPPYQQQEPAKTSEEDYFREQLELAKSSLFSI